MYVCIYRKSQFPTKTMGIGFPLHGKLFQSNNKKMEKWKIFPIKRGLIVVEKTHLSHKLAPRMCSASMLFRPGMELFLVNGCGCLNCHFRHFNFSMQNSHSDAYREKHCFSLMQMLDL